MLESELYDRESNDNAAGGRDTGELNPGVPAAVFQPPQVVFQPPTARPEPAARSARARAAVRPEPVRRPAGRPGRLPGARRDQRERRWRR